MIEHSAYLDLPLRSLRDLYDEVAAHVLEREQQQEALIEAITDAELSLCFENAEELRQAHDRLGDELGPLRGRLDEIEEELAWALRGEERRDNPITLS